MAMMERGRQGREEANGGGREQRRGGDGNGGSKAGAREEGINGGRDISNEVP